MAITVRHDANPAAVAQNAYNAGRGQEAQRRREWLANYQRQLAQQLHRQRQDNARLRMSREQQAFDNQYRLAGANTQARQRNQALALQQQQNFLRANPQAVNAMLNAGIAPGVDRNQFGIAPGMIGDAPPPQDMQQQIAAAQEAARQNAIKGFAEENPLPGPGMRAAIAGANALTPFDIPMPGLTGRDRQEALREAISGAEQGAANDIVSREQQRIADSIAQMQEMAMDPQERRLIRQNQMSELEPLQEQIWQSVGGIESMFKGRDDLPQGLMEEWGKLQGEVNTLMSSSLKKPRLEEHQQELGMAMDNLRRFQRRAEMQLPPPPTPQDKVAQGTIELPDGRRAFYFEDPKTGKPSLVPYDEAFGEEPENETPDFSSYIQRMDFKDKSQIIEESGERLKRRAMGQSLKEKIAAIPKGMDPAERAIALANAEDEVEKEFKYWEPDTEEALRDAESRYNRMNGIQPPPSELPEEELIPDHVRAMAPAQVGLESAAGMVEGIPEDLPQPAAESLPQQLSRLPEFNELMEVTPFAVEAASPENLAVFLQTEAAQSSQTPVADFVKSVKQSVESNNVNIYQLDPQKRAKFMRLPLVVTEEEMAAIPDGVYFRSLNGAVHKKRTKK